MIETGADLKDARIEMGLSLEAMREALRLGENGVAYLRRIERGAEWSGPVSVAVSIMLRIHRGELVDARR